MINVSLFPQTGAILAMVNPLLGPDHQIAGWFHAHLSHTFVNVLRALSEPGSSEWIGVVLCFAVALFVWKKWWPSLVTLLVAVPGGMLLNELLKLAIHRHRPFLDGWFVDWSGYSFASGHTIGATLLYGQFALFVLPLMKSRHWQRLIICLAAMLVLLVGFSRVALGAHYLTDVVAAMLFGIFWLAFCAIAAKPIRRSIVAVPVPVVEASVATTAATFDPAANPALES